MSLADSLAPPFGFVGFEGLAIQNCKIKDNQFKSFQKYNTIDYRTFVDYVSGNGALFFPQTFTTYTADSKIAIAVVEAKMPTLEITGNTFENFNISVSIHSTATVSNAIMTIGKNKHINVDAAYIAKTDDPSEQDSFKTLSIYGDEFLTVDIAILSAQFPAYAKGCTFKNVNSCMALASIADMVYGAILDIDNNFIGDNFKFYDFTGNESFYVAAQTDTNVHKHAFFIPQGAEYYQPAETTYRDVHTQFYINHVQSLTFVSGGWVTIRRAVSEAKLTAS
jgi:hypothetical protein